MCDDAGETTNGRDHDSGRRHLFLRRVTRHGSTAAAGSTVTAPVRPRRAMRIAAVLALGVCLGCGLAAGYERTIGCRGPQLPADAQQLLILLNTVRAKASCPPLTASNALVAMAQAQADDMVTRGFLSSVNPDNQDPVSRAWLFGYSGTVTESFAAGLATPSEVVRQWTNPQNTFAAPVRQRIQTCRMVRVGIGHDTGTATPSLAAHVWVLTLGDR